MAAGPRVFREKELSVATTERIDRDELEGFFDRLSKEREGQPVTIEVIDKSIGDQEEAQRLPRAAATFDPKDVRVNPRSGRGLGVDLAWGHTRSPGYVMDKLTTRPPASMGRSAPQSAGQPSRQKHEERTSKLFD
jgi:hypothetical protein